MIDSFHFSIVKKKNVIIIKEAFVDFDRPVEEQKQQRVVQKLELSLFILGENYH